MKNRLLKVTISLALALAMCVSGSGTPFVKDVFPVNRVLAASFEPEDKSFFDDFDLTESTETAFVMRSAVVDIETDEYVKDVDFPVEFSIEEGDASKPGYRTIKGTFFVDTSGIDDEYSLIAWFSAFDRDTGICLESAGAEEFDVSYSSEMKVEKDQIHSVTLSLTCPEDYRGAIFYCGYMDADMRDAGEKIDITKKSYRIDELPYFKNEGKDNVYFKDTTGREIKKYAIDKKDIKDSVQERSSRSIKVGDSEVSF
nr:hypothetical protein [Lachnospiraceae bacterium]